MPDAFDKANLTWDGIELTFIPDGTEIIATASADLTDEVPYTSPKRKTWNSTAQAIVKTVPGAKVKVTAKGLKPAETIIK